MGIRDGIANSKYLQVRRDSKEAEKILRADQRDVVSLRNTIISYCDTYLKTIDDEFTLEVVRDSESVIGVIDSLYDTYDIEQGKDGVPNDKQGVVFVFRLKQVDFIG